MRGVALLLILASACKVHGGQKETLAKPPEVTDRITTASVAFAWKDGEVADVEMIRHAITTGADPLGNNEQRLMFKLAVAKIDGGFLITPTDLQWWGKSLTPAEQADIRIAHPFDPLVVDEDGLLREIHVDPAKGSDAGLEAETRLLWGALAGDWARGLFVPGVARTVELQNAKNRIQLDEKLEGHTPGGTALFKLNGKSGLKITREGFLLADPKTLHPVLAYQAIKAGDVLVEYRFGINWMKSR